MSIASHQLEHEALDVLKSEIISLTPRAFTSLAVEVILTLRYGSHNIPEESDPEFVNVKNVIIRDPLGLDTIYVRACHRTMDHVGEPEILDFVNSMGALKKGIYITDGDFTQEAVKFAENSEKTINLIDLAQLTQIMNRFNIGLKIHRLMEIKMIDHTFFDELEL
ncbi:MAG: restriction endonuclease [Deltaproteobacteria bacterium]|nr:restriction endonuclease [Deltaproteobacteria bacterium]